MRCAIIVMMLLGGCSTQANHLGNPLLLPLSGIVTAADNAVYAQRRGRVEVFVKSNHPQLIADINEGGGSTLTEAMEIAGVPTSDRPARLIQFRADRQLYRASPSALVTALMVYSN